MPAPPVAPKPAAQPAPAQPSAPSPTPRVAPAPTGGARLAGSISIKLSSVQKPQAPRLQADVAPLTDESLCRYWDEAAKELGLVDLMKDGTVHLGEKNGHFEVQAQTTWFHDEFKPHKMEVLELMRKKSGMPMLDCKVTPLFVAKDEVLYSPDQKYNAMLDHNPNLMGLRRLLPNIDY